MGGGGSDDSRVGEGLRLGLGFGSELGVWLAVIVVAFVDESHRKLGVPRSSQCPGAPVTLS